MQGRGRQGRYHVIRVDSPFALSGAALEEAFRLAIIDFRRLIRYSGPIWYANEQDFGSRPAGYVDFLDYYDDGYFEPPDDIADQEYPRES